MLERGQIQSIVFRALDRTNEVLLDDNTLAKEPGTVLLGQGAGLDSMGFVNFVVALEEEIAEGTGLHLNVVDELNASSDNAHKPATVGELIDFLFALARQKAAGS